MNRPDCSCPDVAACPWHRTRDYSGIAILSNRDPFRRYHLSGEKERAQVAQQRRIEGPVDKFDAKALGAQTGRIYIGDDTSGMTARAQAALKHGKGQSNHGRRPSVVKSG